MQQNFDVYKECFKQLWLSSKFYEGVVSCTNLQVMDLLFLVMCMLSAFYILMKHYGPKLFICWWRSLVPYATLSNNLKALGCLVNLLPRWFNRFPEPSLTNIDFQFSLDRMSLEQKEGLWRSWFRNCKVYRYKTQRCIKGSPFTNGLFTT